MDAAIVRNLIELARELELATVAKGVETRDAWDAVARMGCDRTQGFYLQRPLPAADLKDWLAHSWPAVAVDG